MSLKNTRLKKRRANEIDFYVGVRLREYRLEKGITLSTMAKELGVGIQVVHKYEKGITRVSCSRLYHICNYLQKDPSEFFPPFNFKTEE